jgi:hypothetical protein
MKHKPESRGHNVTSIDESSIVIRDVRADTESRVSVSSGGKESACVSSLFAIDRGTETQSRVQSGSKGNIFVSDVIAVSTDTDSQVTVHSGGKRNASISITEGKDRRNEEPDNFITSSALENGYEGIALAAEPSLHRYREVDEVEFDDIVHYAGCRNRYIANVEENGGHVNDNSNIISSEMCGKYCLNKSEKTAKEERRIEEETIIDQSCVRCVGSVKICSYTNDFILNESNNPPIHDSDFRTTSDNCSRIENYFKEHADEIMICTELPVNEVSEEAESVLSDLNSPTAPANYVPPTDFEHYVNFVKTSDKCAFQYHQLPSANNKEAHKNVDSTPTRHHAADRMRHSAATSDCDSGRKTKPLVRRPESDDSAPDISLLAGEAVEAVICARQLLRVLERALNRAFNSNTDRSNTEVSPWVLSTNFSAGRTRRKQRPRSLSPNILRHFNRIDSVCSQTQTEICSDRDYSALGADTGESNTKGANEKQTSDVKPPLSSSGVFMRSCCYRDAAPFLSLSPEQLRKQRALLRPATDRRIQGDVQLFDMADILRNAISRRRMFIGPTDEFICGSNTSVFE